MNNLKKKYYVWRVERIVKRLHAKANRSAKARGEFLKGLSTARAPQYLSAKESQTWFLARKAQWMLKHNAPNENDITGLDFDPKKDENTLFPFEKTNAEKDAHINYDAPQGPGIVVTFWNPTTGQIQKNMNEPGGAMALYNGSPQHPQMQHRSDRYLSEAGRYRWDAWMQYGENWRDHVPDYVAPEPVEDEDEQLSED